MATGSVTPPLAAARRGLRDQSVLHRRLAASPMKDESVVPTNGGKEETASDILNVSRGASHPGFSSSLCNQPSEFHASKKRCSKQHAEKYICFVAVKNDDHRRTVLNSVVGTLDVCVRHPLHGEIFPAEPGKSSLHCRIYQPDQPKFGYVTNVCVAKYARRQGIASNMLLLAIDAAKLNGAKNLYIHVHTDNLPAWRLYDQIGFKMVDLDGASHSSNLCLLSFSL